MAVNPLGLLFCVGIAAGWLYRKSRPLGPKFDLGMLAAATAGIGVFFSFLQQDGHGIQTSFLCLSILLAALSLERILTRTPKAMQAVRPLVFLGNISYSIYMLHVLFVSPGKALGLPPAVTLLLVTAATIAASSVSYYLIEKRLTGYLKRRLSL